MSQKVDVYGTLKEYFFELKEESDSYVSKLKQLMEEKTELEELISTIDKEKNVTNEIFSARPRFGINEQELIEERSKRLQLIEDEISVLNIKYSKLKNNSTVIEKTLQFIKSVNDEKEKKQRAISTFPVEVLEHYDSAAHQLDVLSKIIIQDPYRTKNELSDLSVKMKSDNDKLSKYLENLS